MSRFLLTCGTVAAVAALAASVPVAHAAPFAAFHTNAVSPAATAASATPRVNHKLISVFTNYSEDTSGTFGPGFTTLASQPIKCANAAGCTITMHLFGEINGAVGDSWTLCATVDGVLANPSPGGGCPFLGNLAATTYTSASAQYSMTVATGTHTVVFEAYSTGTGTIPTWSTEYGLYTP